MTAICFVCGESGGPDVGSQMVCNKHPEGEVKWRTYEVEIHKLTDKTIWDGKVIPYVDFTKPDAMSSPA